MSHRDDVLRVLDELRDVLGGAELVEFDHVRAAIAALPEAEPVSDAEAAARLEILAATAASAPFPIHDYMSAEQWGECCHLYAKHRKVIDAARKREGA